MSSTPLLPSRFKVCSLILIQKLPFVLDCILKTSPYVCSCRLVLSLENDLTVRSKTTEIDVKDFVAGSYVTILGQEVSLALFFSGLLIFL